MKFSELTIGQRFEFEGEPYLKSAPLIATHAETGKQKFMARYAMVKPEGGERTGAAEQPEKQVALSDVLRAFDTFCRECEPMLGELPAEKAAVANATLEKARKAFLDSLN